eukprot:2601077-Pyramimonas_sp.AAC.1
MCPRVRAPVDVPQARFRNGWSAQYDVRYSCGELSRGSFHTWRQRLTELGFERLPVRIYLANSSLGGRQSVTNAHLNVIFVVESTTPRLKTTVLLPVLLPYSEPTDGRQPARGRTTLVSNWWTFTHAYFCRALVEKLQSKVTKKTKTCKS